MELCLIRGLCLFRGMPEEGFDCRYYVLLQGQGRNLVILDLAQRGAKRFSSFTDVSREGDAVLLLWGLVM